MNLVVKRIITIITLTAVLSAAVFSVSKLLENKDSVYRYYTFYHDKEEMDVFFIGSSHVSHGFFPMELWGNEGITSYNLGGNGNTLPVSYWILKNALDYHTPKVVVVDVFTLWPGEKISEHWGQLNASIDAMPFSINKFRMVMDLCDDETMISRGKTPAQKWEMLFNLGSYHSRWNELSERDFQTRTQIKAYSDIWRGAEALYEYVPRIEHVYSEDTSNIEFDTLSFDYLQKIISLCDKKGIEVLLINTGYDCSDESKFFSDNVEAWAKTQGLSYVDFVAEDIIDFKTDLQTSGDNTHVNYSGAIKFTDFIGRELSAYNLTDHRYDSEYSDWNENYHEFNQHKLYRLNVETNPTIFLMGLYSIKKNVIIEVLNREAVSKSEITVDMLNNLGANINYSEDDFDAVSADDIPGLITISADNTQCEVWSDFESGTVCETQFGAFGLFENAETGTYGYYLNSKEIMTGSTDDGRFDIRIFISDPDSGEIVNTSSFCID